MSWCGHWEPLGWPSLQAGSCCGSALLLLCSERAHLSLPSSVGGGHTSGQLSCSHQGQALRAAGVRLFTCSLDFCISRVWACFGPSLPMWIDHSEKWHDGDTCAVDSVGVFKSLRRKLAWCMISLFPLTVSFSSLELRVTKSVWVLSPPWLYITKKNWVTYFLKGRFKVFLPNLV